jgi:DNA-binding NarL/FixJ family response regulator
VPHTRVLVLADDLIWSTRLVADLRRIGADPIAVRTVDRVRTELALGDALIVDLTARAYDGIGVIAETASQGHRVIAIGQHDDLPLRKAALAAGAERVYAYRKLFEDAPATLGAWLSSRSSAR